MASIRHMTILTKQTGCCCAECLYLSGSLGSTVSAKFGARLISRVGSQQPSRPGPHQGCRPARCASRAGPITSVLGAKSRFWAADGAAVGVEELALQYYATPEAGGWKGGR